jgi:hypothetical protein
MPHSMSTGYGYARSSGFGAFSGGGGLLGSGISGALIPGIPGEPSGSSGDCGGSGGSKGRRGTEPGESGTFFEKVCSTIALLAGAPQRPCRAEVSQNVCPNPKYHRSALF